MENIEKLINYFNEPEKEHRKNLRFDLNEYDMFSNGLFKLNQID